MFIQPLFVLLYLVRMRQHETNAMAVATYLEAHPKVESVLYPGKRVVFVKKQRRKTGP
jgi:cystathionine beta-lyase/cystathionine gamma-synthase